MKRRLPFHSNSVLPPIWMVATFAMVYGFFEACISSIERIAPKGIHFDLSEMPEIANVRTALFAGAAVCYAIFRLVRFHPAANRYYAEWLRNSPWTASKPLPLGPIHPVWQDAVVIGSLTALGQWRAHLALWLPIIAFGITYLAAINVLLMITRTWAACFWLEVLWPSFFLTWNNTVSSAAIVAAIITVAWLGVRQSLKRFPWQHLSDGSTGLASNDGKSILTMEIALPATKMIPTHLGWPFQRLSPKPGVNPIKVTTSFCLAALVGWWTFCTMVGGAPSEPAVLLFLAVIAALFRCVFYCGGVVPPMNLWGRIATGRIIFPGFDYVFVSPTLAVALAFVGSIAVRHSGSWKPEVCAITMAAIFFTLLAGGPTVRHWTLTGQLRFRAPSFSGSNRQQLKAV